MYPYQTQTAPPDGSQVAADPYPQYYQQQQQRQSQDQYGQAQPEPSSQTSAQQQQQQQQQQQMSSSYYQGQYAAGPYYYQMPVAAQDPSNPSSQQDRGYQQPIYGYSGGYAAPAPGQASAPQQASRSAPQYPYYANDVSVMYGNPEGSQPMAAHQSQAQVPVAAQSPAQAQAQAQAMQSHITSGQVASPHLAPQQAMYAHGNPYRPAAPVQTPISSLPLSSSSASQTAATPTHRATVSTHLSAIPASMPVTDPTGQTAPPGIKPRVTTTLWEDEGTTCFQVEARGFCVARREDNDMINGTKLLNVAGMTRGRRDGLLKGERNRHVVKAGAMHLKGVWIPYDRALDFANKERIVDLLYPLFVTDIKSVLYHPGNPDLRSASQSGNTGSDRSVAAPPPHQQPHQQQPHQQQQHQQQHQQAQQPPHQQQQQQPPPPPPHQQQQQMHMHSMANSPVVPQSHHQHTPSHPSSNSSHPTQGHPPSASQPSQSSGHSANGVSNSTVNSSSQLNAHTPQPQGVAPKSDAANQFSLPISLQSSAMSQPAPQPSNAPVSSVKSSSSHLPPPLPSNGQQNPPSASTQPAPGLSGDSLVPSSNGANLGSGYAMPQYKREQDPYNNYESSVPAGASATASAPAPPHQAQMYQ